MIDYFLVGLFTALLIGQHIFWSKLCLNLTNRIMSRSYEELRQAERKPPKPRLAPIPTDDLHDPVADRQAKELNSMLGMV